VILHKVYHEELKQAHGEQLKFQHPSLRRAIAAPWPESAAVIDKTEPAEPQRGRAPAAAPVAEVPASPRTGGAVVPKLQNRAAAAAGAPAAAEAAHSAAQGRNRVIWKKHEHRSCQNYAGEPISRSLEESKAACLENDACVAIECDHGSERGCTLRAIANVVPYDPADCYEEIEVNAEGKYVSIRVHPEYNNLLQQYPFQQVTTQTGNQVNIILVRSQMDSYQKSLYQKYKDEILFLGISSMNDYPLSGEDNWVGMFPGFLHMMREPEKHFPPHVKTLLMSQSDFSLPDFPARDYSVPRKYDFTYSASDCDVLSDGAGWCGWSKNWSFVKEVLPIMCEEFNLKGVLVATKDKSGRHAYTIPESCKGKMIQTTYLANQQDYFHYLKQSRFAFLPQIHDASPRVASQALSMDTPLLMNYHIQGGWKYVNDKTGEFFHDASDFRQSLKRILENADTPHKYEPRKWVLENYGNHNSGKRLLEFVKEHFSDRVSLPKGTKLLLT